MKSSRRDFLKTAGAVAGSGVALSSLPRSVAAEEESMTVQRPNILFFFPDQHRYDWIGTTPEIPVRTPNLDALGNRGIRSSRAVCASPLCAPSRACLAAGKEYHRCRVVDNGEDYPLDQQTFYTLLREAGYHVTGCGKFDLSKKSKNWGLDGRNHLQDWGFSDGVNNAGKWDAYGSGAERPQDPYMAWLHENGLVQAHLADFKARKGKNNYIGTFPTPLSEEAYCDNWVAEVGLDLIRESPKDKPWFLQINFPGPHPPMDITKRMEKRCRGIDHPQPNRNTQYGPETHNLLRQNYSAMVENIDHWLGVYVEELRKRGELENTLIVYSSDHGEMLGDHNLWGKSKPHQPSIGVPLVLAGPEVKKGRASQALVSVMDLASTFLDYAGLATPEDMDSASLKPLLAGEEDSHRDLLFSGLRDWRTVFDGQYKLIAGYEREDSAMLFDLQEDPLENEDLAARRPDVVKQLREAISS